MATNKPDYLYTIRQEREKWMLEEEKTFAAFIFNNEIMDISYGVIPYFYRKSESTWLGIVNSLKRIVLSGHGP
jgi:hypothetical protein